MNNVTKSVACTRCGAMVAIPVDPDCPQEILAAMARFLVCDRCKPQQKRRVPAPNPIRQDDLWYNRD